MIDCGLVSIITPNFNCGRFIAQTIESVLGQTYQNWELLIQDDCSTDDSIAVALEYAAKDERIKVQKNGKNSGAAITRNNALRRAQGRWIAFLDSDDIWLPEKLERQLAFMVEKGCHFSYTSYQEISEEGIETGVHIKGPRHVGWFLMKAFCWPGCLTVMYEREKVGLLQIEDIKKNNDYAMWLKVIRKADCYLLDECLAKYRRGRVGSVSSHGYTTMMKWHYRLWHDAEGKNAVASLFWTCMNMAFGIYKKQRYVKR